MRALLTTWEACASCPRKPTSSLLSQREVAHLPELPGGPCGVSCSLAAPALSPALLTPLSVPRACHLRPSLRAEGTQDTQVESRILPFLLILNTHAWLLLGRGLANHTAGSLAEWDEVRCQSRIPALQGSTAPHTRAPGSGRGRLRCTEPRSGAAGSPPSSPPPLPPFHTCVCTGAKMEGAILTSAASRWEGREPRGIPLVVWENELHLPVTCGGSTFPTPSGGHS